MGTQAVQGATEKEEDHASHDQRKAHRSVRSRLACQRRPRAFSGLIESEGIPKSVGF